jgi:hypothetical protein
MERALSNETKPPMMDQSEVQRDMIARCRSESCLDPKIPLGIPFAARQALRRPTPRLP